MMGFKKKLTSLIPSDARNQLQNVLTVEWEGQNKTVLVDLPGPEKSNEVEMSGFGSGSGGGGYGRLTDDDEDDRNYLRRSSQSRSRPSRDRSGSSSHDSREYEPTHHRTHTKSPSYSSKTLPPIPSRPSDNRNINTNNNPFAEPEYYPSPQLSSASTYIKTPNTTSSPHFSHLQQSSFSGDAGYGLDFNDSKFSGGRQGERKIVTAGNPWATFRADDVDLLGDLGVSSPTSSRGTRDSGGSSAENPFR
ncbi:hypothetical protein IAR55_002766 [Kwoniella newhampshirensis]|uniref:Uncharacterized protein n=1 Tax=Kwoniella newhampshirensis TaxID=1651941 RepID=A0AAW0YZC3_9TREE